MVEQTQQEIRDRAYELWQADGCAEGKDMDFWLQAEKEILGAPTMAPKIEITRSPSKSTKTAATKRKPAAKKATGTTTAQKTTTTKAATKPRATKSAAKSTAAKTPATSDIS